MADSTSWVDQLLQSTAGKDLLINELIDSLSPSILFGRQGSLCSGLTWAYFGGRVQEGSSKTLIPNGLLTLLPSKTQYIDADYVSTTTVAITTPGSPPANPCVITAAGHPYLAGDVVYINNIIGTTQLNNSFARITAVGPNTVTLDVDASGFGAWSSGGTLQLRTTGGTTEFKVGRSTRLTSGDLTSYSSYAVVTDATSATSYTDLRVSNQLQQDGVATFSVAGAVDVVPSENKIRCDVMELTGALTGNINVIVPPIKRKWAIFNNTTGLYTLTIITPAGTGVTVGQAKRAIVYADGTNVERVTPDT